jgi:hypothetical protein
MANIGTKSERVKQGKANRKGVHAKTKHSKLKSSKNYVKEYRGQGR